MTYLVLGIVDSHATANQLIDALQRKGFEPRDFSIIVRDTVVKTAHPNGVASAAVTGATTGATLGALAGLLVGIGAIAVPGVGALLIGGPIAAALGLTGAAAATVSGAVTGALAGGLVGGLVDLGVPEDEAKAYEERLREGGVLVAVSTVATNEDMVRQVFAEFKADQVRTIQLTTP